MVNKIGGVKLNKKDIAFWFGDIADIKVPFTKKNKDEICISCGCRLSKLNRSFDSSLCNCCFMVDVAEVEAENITIDSVELIGK